MKNIVSVALIVAFLLPATPAFPEDESGATQKAKGLLKRPFITVLCIDRDQEDGSLKSMADYRGRYIGRDDAQDQEPPVEGLLPVLIYLKAGKNSNFKRGWAWPDDAKQCERKPCCAPRTAQQQVVVVSPPSTPDYVPQHVEINNIDVDVEVLIQQSFAITQQAWMPDNCSCGRAYRRYYYHPRRGYWGHSACNRARGFGYGPGIVYR